MTQNENPMNEDGNGFTPEEKPEGNPSSENTVNLELERAKNDLLYAKAEFENTRKRLIREQEQAIRFANEKIVRDLLGVVDLFDMAMTASAPLKQKEDSDLKNFLQGIEMTHKELEQLLARSGVEFVGKAGEAFDPGRHEAISQEPNPESVGQVVKVLQRGCLFQGRLVKPAKVVVGA